MTRKSSRSAKRGRDASNCSKFEVNGRLFKSDFDAALFIILESDQLTLGKFLEMAIREHHELRKQHWKMALLQDKTVSKGLLAQIERGFGADDDLEDGDATSDSSSGNKKPRSDDSHMSDGTSDEGENHKEPLRKSPTRKPVVETPSDPPAVAPRKLAPGPTADKTDALPAHRVNEHGPVPGHPDTKPGSSVVDINNDPVTINVDDAPVVAVPQLKREVLPNNGIMAGQGLQPQARPIQVTAANLPSELVKQCESLFSHAQNQLPELENKKDCAHCITPPKEILMEDRVLLMCYNKHCKLHNKPQVQRVVGWRLLNKVPR